MVTGAFFPAMVIVAVRQRASAASRFRHSCRACGPVARTSPMDGIDVPWTKASFAYVQPAGFPDRPDRQGAFVCTAFEVAGAVDHPAGRSPADSRRSWRALGPPHPDVSRAVIKSTTSAAGEVTRRMLKASDTCPRGARAESPERPPTLRADVRSTRYERLNDPDGADAARRADPGSGPGQTGRAGSPRGAADDAGSADRGRAGDPAGRREDAANGDGKVSERR